MKCNEYRTLSCIFYFKKHFVYLWINIYMAARIKIEAGKTYRVRKDSAIGDSYNTITITSIGKLHNQEIIYYTKEKFILFDVDNGRWSIDNILELSLKDDRRKKLDKINKRNWWNKLFKI